MEIDYTNTRADYLVHSRFAGAYSRVVSNHYFWVAYWGVMAGLGVYASFLAGLIFVAAILVAMFVIYFIRAVPYSRVLKESFRRSALVGDTKRVHLRIDDEGLHETVENLVESFAPWSAFRRFIVTESYLFIELAGDLWANIPRNSIVQGEAAFNELVTILRSHQIPEETT